MTVFRLCVLSAFICTVMLAAAHACEVAIDSPAVVDDAPIVLFGEMHGSKEAPAFVGNFICRSASQGRSTVLALEMPSSEQTLIDSFLLSDGSSDAVAALTSGVFWRREHQDGRSSIAMAALLKLARELNAAGLPVRVRAVDPPYTGSSGRSGSMVENIASILEAEPNSRVVVLLGNVHASRSKGMPWDPEFLPVGYHLRELGSLSLNAGFNGGSIWACSQDEGCGIRSLPSPSRTPGATNTIVMNSDSDAPFDGTFFVGPATASPPARDDHAGAE